VKTYWDMTEKERAALTDERVEFMERLELMGEGVLAAEPWTPEIEPVVPEPDEEVYDVSAGKYSAVLATFASLDAARAFVDLCPVPVETAYHGGTTIAHVGEREAKEISVRRIYSRAQWLAHRQAIEAGVAIRKRNAETEAAREKDAAGAANALGALRNDLAECREKGRRYQRIADVYAQYVATAEGDEEIAWRFLCKAFPHDEIQEAAAWTGAFVDASAPRAAEVSHADDF